MKVLITTVGASGYQNCNREKNIDNLALKDKIDAVYNFLKEKEDKDASAETNSLEKILEEGDFIYFLHSDTELGNICSSALVKYYEEKGYNVLPEKIEHLDYKEKKFKLEGLHSLVNKIATLIEKNIKEREVALVATGGFKAEIAYATLIGILFKVKVYYIHEKFKDIIDLPPIPIHLDVRFWHKYEEDLKWIMQYKTEDEIKNRFNGEVPKEFSFLLNYDKDTKQYSLSPAGHAFYRAYSFRKPEIIAFTDRMIEIKRLQDHTTLFGRINSVNEINDEDVRILFERVSSLPYVTSISLGKFNKNKQNETYLKHINRDEDTKVHYKLYCKEGIEYVVINIESGKSNDLVKFIGKKAYP